MKKLLTLCAMALCTLWMSAQQYYIAGNNAALFGGEWNVAGMAMTAEADGTYSATFSTCVAGTQYLFKVTQGDWNKPCWGFADLLTVPDGVTGGSDNNISLKTSGANLKVVFDPATSKITVSGDIYVPGADEKPTIQLAGTMTDWASGALTMTPDATGTTASVTVNFATATATAKFKIINNGSWKGVNNGVSVSRNSNVVTMNGGDDCEMNADVAGDYVFTYAYATDVVTVTYPEGGDDPEPVPSDNIVYFVNAEGWTTVNCYAWAGATSNGWPGVAMKKEAYQLKGADVYSYDAAAVAYENCVFNAGNDAPKTGDLVWTAGKYYYKGAWYTRAELESGEEILPAVKLMGIPDWNGTEMNVADKLTASVTVNLEPNTYEFKIMVGSAWYSNTGTMERTNSTGWVFETSVGDDAHITADIAGDYTFTWTYATNELTVTYPTIMSVIPSAATEVAKPTKVVRDGQVLIVREGVAYTLMGQVAE
ncbi:MAG: starch-binding protein [Paludibacteraceae bacterium]